MSDLCEKCNRPKCDGEVTLYYEGTAFSCSICDSRFSSGLEAVLKCHGDCVAPSQYPETDVAALREYNPITKHHTWCAHRERVENECTCGVAQPTAPTSVTPAVSFKEAALPLIKWLNENVHPHHAVIVTPTGAELMEGQCGTGEVLDYVKD